MERFRRLLLLQYFLRLDILTAWYTDGGVSGESSRRLMDGRFLLTGVEGECVLSRETAEIAVGAAVTTLPALLLTETTEVLSGIVKNDETLRKKNCLAMVESDVTRLPEADRGETLLFDPARLFALILFRRRFTTRRVSSLSRD